MSDSEDSTRITVQDELRKMRALQRDSLRTATQDAEAADLTRRTVKDLGRQVQALTAHGEKLGALGDLLTQAITALAQNQVRSDEKAAKVHKALQKAVVAKATAPSEPAKPEAQALLSVVNRYVARSLVDQTLSQTDYVPLNRYLGRSHVTQAVTNLGNITVKATSDRKFRSRQDVMGALATWQAIFQEYQRDPDLTLAVGKMFYWFCDLNSQHPIHVVLYAWEQVMQKLCAAYQTKEGTVNPPGLLGGIPAKLEQDILNYIAKGQVGLSAYQDQIAETVKAGAQGKHWTFI
jgi:hypothetical protein